MMTMTQTFKTRRPGENVTTDTRAESHEIIDKQKRYLQIVECLAKHGPMTAKETAVALWECGQLPTSERNFTAPRLTELSKCGIVEPIGKRRCQYTGKTVAVYGLREG